jgi:hypothetical protein
VEDPAARSPVNELLEWNGRVFIVAHHDISNGGTPPPVPSTGSTDQ